jgi:S-adenosylmethionine hydrolase
MRPIITLTTDFGAESPYVAQMKGVILSICRDVEMVDISHAIGPQNIREGAVVLADVTPRFPTGTIHLAVVDPGVGTARRIVCAEFSQQHYIAPDNGLLSLLRCSGPPGRFFAVENSKYWLAEPSQTFHGRDIMAPVAAHLARGLDPAKLGSALDDLAMLDWPQARKSGRRLVGEVLYVDSFGNLITNLYQEELLELAEASSMVVECSGRKIRGIVPTYGAAMAGELIALFDSQGRLEIAKVNGNAARELRIQAGEAVAVH